LLFAEGLKRILQGFKNIEVVGLYHEGAEFLTALGSNNPHVVFMDMNLNGEEGILVAKKALKLMPKLMVVALAADEDGYSVHQALQVGMCAYITKKLTVEELKRACEIIKKGDTYITPQAAQNYAHYSMKSSGKIPNISKKDFSEREMNIIKLIGQGKGEKEIAATLNISIKTVESEKKKICAKMVVKKSPQIISTAYKLKILP
jgi:two-component system NarL family response regulator